jgi:hypothetical protein
MMRSNIPAFAVHQDYQLRHSDMLATARQGKDTEVVLRSGLQPYLQPYPDLTQWEEVSNGVYNSVTTTRKLHAEKVAGEWRLKWLTEDPFPVDKSTRNRQP